MFSFLQDDVKVSSKLSMSKSMKFSEYASGSRGGSLLELKETVEEPGEDEVEDEEKLDKPHVELSSDEEGLESEQIIEASRAERIKRSSLQRVHNLKTVFSKDKMDKTRAKTKENIERTKQKTMENIEKTKETLEKTRQKTKDNIEKTKQKTKANLEKTRYNFEKKIEKIGTRMSVNPEHKKKIQTSRDKMKKAFTPDHVVYARSKTAVYKVPPFTFHVKKIRQGAVEVVQGTEMVEVSQDAEIVSAVNEEVEEDAVEDKMGMMNGAGEEEEEPEELEEEDSQDILQENEDIDSD